MAESTQHKLDRVRPPRVQITYDVEIGNAIQMKSLPLVVGILADLIGQAEPQAKLKDRKFIETDRDNFNDVLAYLGPKLKVKVDNKITGQGSLAAELNFRHMDDFHPASVARQIEPLRKLLESRQRLIDLMAKLDGNEELNAALRDLLDNPAGVAEVKALASKTDDASA